MIRVIYFFFFLFFKLFLQLLAFRATVAGAYLAFGAVLSKAFSESEESHDKDDRDNNNVRYHLDSL